MDEVDEMPHDGIDELRQLRRRIAYLEAQEKALKSPSNLAGMMTAEEVADRFGVTGTTVRKWCQSGKLKAQKFGLGNRATWLIPEEALEGFTPPSPGRPS